MNASTTERDPGLQQAYLDTHYIVDATPPFTLIIGEPSADLAALYAAHGVDCCAYLTAFNPHSQRLDDTINAQRQHALIRDVRATGLDTIEGRGQHPGGTWPAEASILILGMDRRQACRLGEKYQQNAIVVGGPTARLELVWI